MKALHALAFMGLALAYSDQSFAGGAYDPSRERAPRKRHVPEVIPKGCKKYIIEGFEVIASNEKNAIRKANNLKLKTNG